MNVERGNRGEKDQLLELVDLLREQYTARCRPRRKLIRWLHRPKGVGWSAGHLTSLGQSKDFTIRFGKQWEQARSKNPALWAGTSGNVGDPLLEGSPEDQEGRKLPEEKLISGELLRCTTMEKITRRSFRK